MPVLQRITWLVLLCVGANMGFAPRTVHAQVDTVRTDTLGIDSLRTVLDSAALESQRADSILFERTKRAALRAADTIKTPIATFAPPPTAETFGRRRWARDEIMQTGAINLADLLDNIPGIATYRTAWFPSLHAAAFNGDFRRVRVFMDGVEMDAPAVGNNGVLDLVEISLAALDEVVVERSAGEVRVWLTTWTVTSTTPYSRTDVYTGDLNTNGFRGLFGRRFDNGALFQFTLDQGETARQRGAAFGGVSQRGETGDGNVRLMTARTGWARGAFSVDGYIANSSRTRDPLEARETAFNIPGYDASRTDRYLRLGYGNAQNGFSAQMVLNRLSTAPRRETQDEFGVPIPQPVPDPDSEEEEPPPLPDSSRVISQRLFYTGYARGGARIGAFARWRNFDGQSDFAPGVTASLDRGWAAATLHGERIGLDSSRRLDANVRLNLRPWLVLSAAHSDLVPDDTTGRAAEQTSQVGGALGWRGRWISGAFIRQAMEDGPRRVIVPQLLTPYDSTAVNPMVAGLSGTGLTFGAEMPLYKALRLEMHGTRWNDSREYRPVTHARASFIVQSEWRSRFPKGHFSINARLTHEYRGAVSFLDPLAANPAETRRETAPYNLGMALLEIRILRATIFYQFRNVYGAQYEQVPGVTMPPPFQLYGVRWEWFN